jgi:hypothetical protein
MSFSASRITSSVKKKRGDSDAFEEMSTVFFHRERVEVYISDEDEWKEATVCNSDDPEGLIIVFDDVDEEVAISWDDVREHRKSLIRSLGVFGDASAMDEDYVDLALGRTTTSGDCAPRKSKRTMDAAEKEEAVVAEELKHSNMVLSVRAVISQELSNGASASRYCIDFKTLQRYVLSTL